MAEHKCQYPDCYVKGTMIANLRLISKDYKPIKGKSAQITCCPYHFTILQNEQFNWVEELNELYGPTMSVSLIENVMAAREIATARRELNLDK